MDLVSMVGDGTASSAVVIGSAFVLGALHALEPGHAKAMIAAFIIAVRGTVAQAVRWAWLPPCPTA